MDKSIWLEDVVEAQREILMLGFDDVHSFQLLGRLDGHLITEAIDHLFDHFAMEWWYEVTVHIEHRTEEGETYAS